MNVHICCLLMRDWPNDKKYAPGLGERYVKRLQMMAHRWAPDADFTCYSDHPIDGVRTRHVSPLTGYCWEKLYLFQPGEFAPGDRVLYVDLDTVICGDLTPLLYVDLAQPIFLDDRGPDGNWPNRRLGAGLFLFEYGPEVYHFWEDFLDCAPPATDELWFDQKLRGAWRSWSDAAPGKVLSYKWDIARRKQLIGDARVIFFHCQPRPHTVNLPWNLHYETRNGDSASGR